MIDISMSFLLKMIQIDRFAAIWLLCALAWTAPAHAAQERVALVIGNAAYLQSPLANPKNDAREMAALLQRAGFKVISRTDANKADLQHGVAEFGAALRDPAVKFGVFYYAGHGVQLAWRNYLVPIDATPKTADDLKAQSVDVSALLAYMKHDKGRSFLVILDACRDDPFAGSYTPESKGLSQFDAPVGSLLAFATSPGRVAMDGAVGASNGLYTAFLLKELEKIGSPIEDAFKRTRLHVRMASKGAQVPWESTSLEDDVFLFPHKVKKLSESELNKQLETELDAWSRVKSSISSADIAQFLQSFPSGSFSEIASAKLNRLLYAESGAEAARLMAKSAAAREARAAEEAQATAEALQRDRAAELERTAQLARQTQERDAAQRAQARAEAQSAEAARQEELQRLAQVMAQERLAAAAREAAAVFLANQTAAAQASELARLAQLQREAQTQAAQLEAAALAQAATRRQEQAQLEAQQQAQALAAQRAQDEAAAAQMRQAAAERVALAQAQAQARAAAAEREQAAATAAAAQAAQTARVALELAQTKALQAALAATAAKERLALAGIAAAATNGAAPGALVNLPVNLPVTPYYKGANEFQRSYAVGDVHEFNVIDLFNTSQRPLQMAVTAVNPEADRVEFNGGEFVSDLMGNILTNRRGSNGTPRQFYPAELFVGKRWQTRFNQIRPDGSTYTFTYNLRVVSRERVTVPAGTFDTFKIEGRGFNLDLGATLERNIWVSPGISADIALETTVRLKNGRFDQRERQELVRYQASSTKPTGVAQISAAQAQ
jgi:hypothetical protein